jgi:DNA-directed RNA polymerase subunit alpha
MRVGNRTDYNRLRLTIETDGSITAKEALEKSIEIMIHQLKAIVGFKEDEPVSEITPTEPSESEQELMETPEDQEDILKTRVEDLNLSVRTMKALNTASIRTVGGLARKAEDDLLELDGLGAKGITEIKRVLSNFGLTLKQ